MKRSQIVSERQGPGYWLLAARGGKGVFQAAHSVWFGTGRNENLPAKEVC